MSTEQSRMLARIEALRASGEPFCIATVVRTADATSAKAGAKAVVSADGRLDGYIGGGCVGGAVRRAALDCLESGEPRLIRVRPNGDVDGSHDADGVEQFPSGCPSGGTVDLFLEPLTDAARLIVCGATPLATALLDLAARLGHRPVLVADAADLDAVIHDSVRHAGFELAPLALQPRDAVVVVTQGRHDRAALCAALLSPAAYVGMVGSRRKIATLLAPLAASVPPARLTALHGPAGLDIGAVGPEEIALSILAEIVAFRRRGAGAARPAERHAGDGSATPPPPEHSR